MGHEQVIGEETNETVLNSHKFAINLPRDFEYYTSQTAWN